LIIDVGSCEEEDILVLIEGQSLNFEFVRVQDVLSEVHFTNLALHLFQRGVEASTPEKLPALKKGD
jgi:hypothetical protein